MNHYQLILLILVGLLTIPAHLQLCTLPDSQTLLQSGHRNLISDQSETGTYHEKTFPISFQVPSRGVQIAASLYGYYSTRRGVGYRVWGFQSARLNMGVIAAEMNKPNKWTSLRISFLVSGRPDFTIGYFEASNTNVGDVTTSYKLPGNSKDTTVTVQICGVYGFSSNFSVNILEPIAFFVTGILSVTLRIVAPYRLNKVYFTYVRWSNDIPFTHRSFPGKQLDLPYRFLGLDGMSFKSTTLYGHEFISQHGITCRSSFCPSKCVSRQTCTGRKGRISNNKCILTSYILAIRLNNP